MKHSENKAGVRLLEGREEGRMQERRREERF